MIELLKALLFGIVEGITEWLPVSSTGHLIILESFLPLHVSDEFYTFFEVVIQFGAILAVVLLFWKKIWPFGKKNNKAPLTQNGVGAYVKMDIMILWFHILVSCVPAAVIGILLDDWIDEHLYHPITVAVMLITVGIVFIIVETVHSGKHDKIAAVKDITYSTALLIGIFQVIAAVLPGTSRSGATIVGALLIGVSRSVAAEYTFYLAIPVMFGASLLKGYKYLGSGAMMSQTEIGVLFIGFVVSFIVSIFVINFLLSYIKKHDFKVFGYYRIIIGIVVLSFALAGVI
ncbi:MAG: undecaprenyl-diphosphate phosphatase [Agathobacter sp.]|uniref:undecaprenyl-diphosphate phosphatase n=1 Tax=Agathobacter sp. TaxID=2021311 RepID=UPI00257E36FC|nr:undecaprenyl-diphosphate phosphatase [Agathobacter sp.]MBQ1681968.1 undecaprenyl-diphosphate phosphatase [Agathobacter sp.]